MTAFTSKTIQQIRGLIILGGLTFLAIPFALILSGTAFILILIGLGCLVAEVAWKKMLWITIKLSKPKRGGQLWTEEEKQKKIAEGEKKRLMGLHYMKCPKCGMELIEIDYKGIKVDKCSRCEGIWLDAGELEAISKVEGAVLYKLFNVFKV
jgi:predicted Zn-ribbon and HTH transcriptional regulator